MGKLNTMSLISSAGSNQVLWCYGEPLAHLWRLFQENVHEPEFVPQSDHEHSGEHDQYQHQQSGGGGGVTAHLNNQRERWQAGGHREWRRGYCVGVEDGMKPI